MRTNTLARSAILSRGGSPLWLPNNAQSERVCRPIARHHAKTERRNVTATNHASEGGRQSGQEIARARNFIHLVVNDRQH